MIESRYRAEADKKLRAGRIRIGFARHRDHAALAAKIPIMTTVRAAQASANGIRSLQKSKVQVRSLQECHAAI